ncbi:MAG: riboflavin synthase [Elusimicrobia bacterium]|nr:riboflavin synthase [Elusimicrobiota bacterium]
MFTGIIQDIGIPVQKKQTGETATFKIKTNLTGINTGDSIAVNGVCLTARHTENSNSGTLFQSDISGETLRRTNLRLISPGTKVNLETSLRADGKLGGHILTGHVQTTIKLLSIKKDIFTFSCPAGVSKYVVPKGSVAIDGISLTVTGQKDNWFTVAVIPHTLKNTTLQFKKPGDTLNIEPDIFSKYVEKHLKEINNRKKISMEDLKKYGW